MPRSLEQEFQGATFDDFLFRPQRGVMGTRRVVKLESRLSRRLGLALPIVSANMDSVTAANMGKTMALHGGLGVLHRAQSIDDQVEGVRRVKRSQGFVVERPLSLPRDATIREAREFTRTHRITGLVIEESKGSGLLAGILSNRDMPWVDQHEDERVEQFMTPVARLRTAAPGISAEEAERIMFDSRIEKLPLVDAARRIHGLITKKDIILSRQLPHSSKDAKGRLLVAAAIGARGDFLERARDLTAAGADALVIDIAHGHSDIMREAIEAVRAHLGDVELICGNVGTAEGAAFLKAAGADAIKVGIGPGRGCRTRLETAAGVPQLQAIREAWCAVEEEIPIIADGGIRDDKDIVLALACGASTVMLGSVLAGTDEAPGRVIEDPATRQKRKLYRGMTSPQAVFEALYDADEQELENALDTPAEGQEVQIPYKGSVVNILRRIRGHLQSAMSYAGTATLAEMRARVTPTPGSYLVRLTEASRRESYER